MPTSDPTRRREQNRDNQKKYRVRQAQQMTDLRIAFEAQTTQLSNAERDVKKLQRKNADAMRMIAQLRAINSSLLAHLTAVPEIGTPLSIERDVDLARNALVTGPRNESAINVTAEAQSETQQQTCTPSDLVGQVRVSGTGYLGLETLPWPQFGAELSLASPMSYLPEFTVTSGASFAIELDQNILPIAHDPQSEWNHGCEESSASDEDAQISRGSDPDGSNNEPYCNGHTDDVEPRASDYGALLPQSHQADGDQFQPPCDARSEADVPSDILRDDLLSFETGVITELPQSLTSFPATSRISKHILAATRILRREFVHVQANFIEHQAIRTAVSWMLRQAWPASAACLKLMAVYQQIYNYELWRNFPCKATYNNIHPMYRPTALQLVVPHPPAIDWLPWPTLREKAIELQDEIDVDLLNMTALRHTIIERRPPRTAVGQPSAVLATFRAWDVYLLERNSGVYFDESSMSHQPKSSCVQALLQRYSIEMADISQLRLEQAFFNIFPSLWSPSMASGCKTMPLRCSNLELLDYPSDLDWASLESLESSITLTAASDGLAV